MRSCGPKKTNDPRACPRVLLSGQYRVIASAALNLFWLLVEAVDPVGEVVVEEVDDRAERPGDGVGHVDILDLVDDAHDDGDIRDPDHTPEQQHDDHRHESLARAAADRCDGMGVGEQAEEQRGRAHLPRAEGDDVRRGAEEGDELRREQIHRHADQLRDDDGGDDAEARTLLGAVMQTGTEILADKGRQRHGEARDGQESEALQLGIRAVGGHGDLAEGVDVGLHDDVGKADDRVLHAGGQAVADDLAEHFAVDAQLLRLQLIDRALFHQMDEAQHHAHGLRDRRGDGRGPHAPAEAADEQQIEHDIGQRRDDEVIERPLAVAKRVHDARAHVVHDDGQHAEEIILEIRDRVRQDLRRGAHPAQERRRQQNAHDGQHDAAEQTQHHVGMNGLGYAAIVARAEVPRDRDACAHGKPRKEADEQEDERPGRTDGRQRLIAEKPTDDQRVRRIVKLLKDLTEEHGHGKLRDQLPRTY